MPHPWLQDAVRRRVRTLTRGASHRFFLAQLDADFDRVYGQLASATRGFLRGWYGHWDKAFVVDKNRAWLRNIEHLLHVEPEARLLICVRELGQVYGSIEAQYQRTILVGFADHTAGLDQYGRADVLFNKDGVIGSAVHAIEAGRPARGESGRQGRQAVRGRQVGKRVGAIL